MKKQTQVVLFILLIACNSSKNIASSSEKNITTLKKNLPSLPVSFVILNNYAVNSSVPLPDTINYKYIVSAADFNKTFHMTKASPGTATVPDFSQQAVVAIILQPTEKVVSIDILKAEISDRDLHVYYTITDTASWTTYPHTIKAAAAVPKSDSVKQIHFYNNNARTKSVLSGN